MRALLVTAILLAAALAGCAEDSVRPASAATKEPIVITDVDDIESLSNQTFSNESHLHDYWGGKERLNIMDETIDDSTFFIAPRWFTSLAPPPGSVVPQGASEVQVTVTWTDSPTDTYGSPELWVRTAAQNEPTLIGAVEQGQTFVIPIALPDADLPHQTLSAWRFDFVLHPGASGRLIWFSGTVTMQAEAVRGLQIPVYPPHPDLWNEREEIPLFEDETDTIISAWQGDPEGSSNCIRNCPTPHHPVDKATVPYDAARVEVTLTMGDLTPTRLALSYHAADSREWTRLKPDAVDGAKQTYIIPVLPRMGDGPYASQSQWEFLPFIEYPREDGVSTAEYTISARVLRYA